MAARDSHWSRSSCVPASSNFAAPSLATVVEQADALKKLLTQMWEEADGATRKHYEKKEQEDRARYERELAAWNQYKSPSEA